MFQLGSGVHGTYLCICQLRIYEKGFCLGLRSITIQQMAGLSETLGLTFAANGKPQIFKGKYHMSFRQLIHASILMYSTVQIVLNSNN